MSTPYQPGNEFLPGVLLADAAVEWEQIPQEELENVIINDDGFPVHPKYPKLTARADALYDAAMRRHIEGHTHNGDGYDLHPSRVRLDRDSVASFIKATEKRLSTKKNQPRLVDEAAGQNLEKIERLLRIEEVMELVNRSKSSIYEKMKKSEFPENSHDGPTRWRYSDIAKYVTMESINAAKGTGRKAEENS